MKRPFPSEPEFTSASAATAIAARQATASSPVPGREKSSRSFSDGFMKTEHLVKKQHLVKGL